MPAAAVIQRSLALFGFTGRKGAHKLLKFLKYFLGISSEGIPHNSIVREFVGGSVFPV